METKTASEMWDIMEELGIAVDKSFIEPCDLTPPTLEELCRMFGVNSLVQWLSDINKKKFARRFNKYGWGLAAPVIMSNGE